MDKGDPEARSTFEWQSVGRIRIDMFKRKAPERWRRLPWNKKTKFKNASMWWDLHLKYRKRLVLFQKFPEDEDDYQDVLDEIEEDNERRKEVRE